MKFVADMGISPRTVLWLREQGYNVIHLFERELHCLQDERIITLAKEENRIILTLDLDFSRIISLSGEQFPSIISFRLNDQTPQVINSYLLEVLSNFTNELKHGAIISVKSDSIRSRSLPMKKSNA